jgi:hypothetical protein
MARTRTRFRRPGSLRLEFLEERAVPNAGVTTSNIQAQLLAETGQGQVLGNLLYNVANLLNPDGTTTLLLLLTQLADLGL